MRSHSVNPDTRRSFWRSVREYAVPPSMIESATSRRRAGDWAGACAAAHIDVDLSLRSVSGTYGRDLAERLRADLRHLAPDLLRWHMPRIAPDGLLRPGLTISLARYDPAQPDDGGAVHLVVRTPPGWAGAGQRISLALWDGSRSRANPCRYPHPRPDRRFRLDLHRHLWDVRRIEELRARSGADRPPGTGRSAEHPGPLRAALRARGCAVDRWAAEAAVLLRAEGRTSGPVAVRIGTRQRLVLHPVARDGEAGVRISTGSAARAATLPLLPDAATWVLPDLDLVRHGLIEPDRLHPLVASALVPDHRPADPRRGPHQTGWPRLVDCGGAQHRIGLVDGELVPLDHDPAEIRREELLAALSGTPLPCLQAIDEAHRHPECLADVRARLDHGDLAGALAAVEGLLGAEALLRGGALREELERAASQRVVYGLFRSGLVGAGTGPTSPDPRRTREHRCHPRHAMSR